MTLRCTAALGSCSRSWQSNGGSGPPVVGPRMARDRDGQVDRPIVANVLLVAPDRVHVWRPGADKSAPPDWSFDAGPWLDPYFTRLKIPAHEVAPHVFEQIVGLWLRDVADGELPGGDIAENASDLFSGVRGGEVVEQMAA